MLSCISSDYIFPKIAKESKCISFCVIMIRKYLRRLKKLKFCRCIDYKYLTHCAKLTLKRKSDTYTTENIKILKLMIVGT